MSESTSASVNFWRMDSGTITNNSYKTPTRKPAEHQVSHRNMSDEESIRDPGHLVRTLDRSDGSNHNKLHVKQGRKRSTSIKTSGDSSEGEDNVDDLDLSMMTKMLLNVCVRN